MHLKPRLLRVAALALVLAAPAFGPARAQDATAPPPGLGYPTTQDVPSQVLTLDQERLFSESLFGKRVTAEIEDRARALAAENRKIEADLEAEEQALTEARPTLPVEEFRSRADAFDAKVQKIRAEQAAKSRALNTFRDSEQQRFAAALGSVLADVARQRGALLVIDRRVALISADSIDVTDDVVAAMDARLGDGAEGAPKE
ncbi:OmpH family outer membrane protein [Frigidibacter sp. ROC022]|uniref:OmpH family outer membrane protein n=1 Tax=Frigidibacter sp. ROC022 TaxID=2971796 RepID=UPI00215B1C37|nr:OmpH family outer membrane protein [Frigidibacter sp. ROC022]MCR8723840.1 OmpH family outer membrane protein [Frigidibacter sp. ROC022]